MGGQGQAEEEQKGNRTVQALQNQRGKELQGRSTLCHRVDGDADT